MSFEFLVLSWGLEISKGLGEALPEVLGGSAGVRDGAVFADHGADLIEDGGGFVRVLAEAVAPPAAPVSEFAVGGIGMPGHEGLSYVLDEGDFSGAGL